MRFSSSLSLSCPPVSPSSPLPCRWLLYRCHSAPLLCLLVCLVVTLRFWVSIKAFNFSLPPPTPTPPKCSAFRSIAGFALFSPTSSQGRITLSITESNPGDWAFLEITVHLFSCTTAISRSSYWFLHINITVRSVDPTTVCKHFRTALFVIVIHYFGHCTQQNWLYALECMNMQAHTHTHTAHLLKGTSTELWRRNGTSPTSTPHSSLFARAGTWTGDPRDIYMYIYAWV